MFLYILKQKKLDIKLIINYYFEDRKTFMDKLVEIGGTEILEYLKISKEVNDKLSQKLLVSIDKKFVENIDVKELSHQLYVNRIYSQSIHAHCVPQCMLKHTNL